MANPLTARADTPRRAAPASGCPNLPNGQGARGSHRREHAQSIQRSGLSGTTPQLQEGYFQTQPLLCGCSAPGQERILLPLPSHAGVLITPDPIPSARASGLSSSTWPSSGSTVLNQFNSPARWAGGQIRRSPELSAAMTRSRKSHDDNSNPRRSRKAKALVSSTGSGDSAVAAAQARRSPSSS